MYASQSWVKELVTRLFKRVISSHDTTKIDGVLYIEDIPICLTQDVTIYVDTVNGSDETGDGSETNPFASWEYVNKLLPKNLNGYNLNLYMSGTYNAVSFSRFASGILSICFVNTPTFYQLYFNQVNCAYLYEDVNIDFSANAIANRAAITVSYNSSVCYYKGTMTITGNTNASYYTRGLQIDTGANFYAMPYSNSVGKIVVKSCYYGIVTQIVSDFFILSSRLSYSGNTKNIITQYGSTVSTS